MRISRRGNALRGEGAEDEKLKMGETEEDVLGKQSPWVTHAQLRVLHDGDNWSDELRT